MPQCLQFAPILLPELLRPLSCIDGLWLAGNSSLHHLPAAEGSKKLCPAPGHSPRVGTGWWGFAQLCWSTPAQLRPVSMAIMGTALSNVSAFKDTILAEHPPLGLWETRTDCRVLLAATNNTAQIYVHQWGSFGVQGCAPHSGLPRCLKEGWVFLLWSQPPSLPELQV